MSFMLLEEHNVRDYAAFEALFNGETPWREKHGSKGMRIFRDLDDPGRVVVLFEMDDLEKARRLAGSVELHEAIEWGTAVTTKTEILVLTDEETA